MRKFLICFPLFLLFFISSIQSNAQTWGQPNYGCFDSLLIMAGGYCFPEYDPVCACNDSTYKNACFARLRGYQIFTSGICEPLDFNIRVNPINLNLDLDIITRFRSDVTLYVIDWYGKVHYQDFFPSLTRRQLMLDANMFNQGIYMVIATSGDFRVVKKFVKVNR